MTDIIWTYGGYTLSVDKNWYVRSRSKGELHKIRAEDVPPYILSRAVTDILIDWNNKTKEGLYAKS